MMMFDWFKNLMPEHLAPIKPVIQPPDELDEDAERLASYGGEPEADDEADLAECDACGEMKPEEGGLHHKGIVHAAMIDPPDESWICADCIYHAEEAQLDRALEARDNLYYEEK